MFLFELFLFALSIKIVTSDSKSYENCYDYDAVDSCFQQYEQLKDDITQLEVNDKKARRHVKKSCGPVLKCLSLITHCDMFGDPEIEPLIEYLQVNCDLVTFLDDSPCYAKLKKSKSECFHTWNAHLSNNQLKDQFSRKMACWNYFGKNACMEKDVTEICGKKEWVAFRDLFTFLVSNIWRECDAADVITGLVTTLTGRGEGWKTKYMN